MKQIIQKFMRDESGATMVEYGLMIALIAMVCAVAVYTLGNDSKTTFTNADTCVKTPASCP